MHFYSLVATVSLALGILQLGEALTKAPSWNLELAPVCSNCSPMRETETLLPLDNNRILVVFATRIDDHVNITAVIASIDSDTGAISFGAFLLLSSYKYTVIFDLPHPSFPAVVVTKTHAVVTFDNRTADGTFLNINVVALRIANDDGTPNSDVKMDGPPTFVVRSTSCQRSNDCSRLQDQVVFRSIAAVDGVNGYFVIAALNISVAQDVRYFSLVGLLVQRNGTYEVQWGPSIDLGFFDDNTLPYALFYGYNALAMLPTVPPKVAMIQQWERSVGNMTWRQATIDVDSLSLRDIGERVPLNFFKIYNGTGYFSMFITQKDVGIMACTAQNDQVKQISRTIAHILDLSALPMQTLGAGAPKNFQADFPALCTPLSDNTFAAIYVNSTTNELYLGTWSASFASGSIRPGNRGAKILSTKKTSYDWLTSPLVTLSAYPPMVAFLLSPGDTNLTLAVATGTIA